VQNVVKVEVHELIVTGHKGLKYIVSQLHDLNVYFSEIT